jgi:hypothetical protein
MVKEDVDGLDHIGILHLHETEACILVLDMKHAAGDMASFTEFSCWQQSISSTQHIYVLRREGNAL